MEPDASSGRPFLVYYRDGVYDLTNFAHKHPGGRNTLSGLENRDIGKRMQSVPPHSDAAMYLMKEYQVAKNKDQNNNANDTAEPPVKLDSGRPIAKDNLTDEFKNKSDESMEVGKSSQLCNCIVLQKINIIFVFPIGLILFVHFLSRENSTWLTGQLP